MTGEAGGLRQGALLKYALLGCIGGLILFWEPAILLFLFVASSIILFVRTRPKEDRDNLAAVLSAAFLMRTLFFTLAITYVYLSYVNIYDYPLIGKIVGHSVQIVRDFEREIVNGKLIASYLRGEFGKIPLEEISARISFQGHGYLHFGAYLQGMLNFLFGESIFNLASLALMSLWLVIVAYYTAKEAFNRDVALSSSFVIAVLPSFNIWSCTNLRTTFAILGMLTMAYSLTLFFKRNRIRFLLPLILSAVIFLIIKNPFFRPAVMIMLFVLLMSLKIRLSRKAVLLTLLFAIAAAALVVSGAVRYKVKDVLGDLVIKQAGFISEGRGSCYKIYDEIVYNIDTVKRMPLAAIFGLMLRALPKGAVYFLFSPFPWEVDNTLRLFGYPQTIFWYFMFAFAAVGFLKAILSGDSKVLPLVCISSFFTAIFSLVLGNEGIAARFRDMVSAFFYMFACSALHTLFFSAKEVKGKGR